MFFGLPDSLTTHLKNSVGQDSNSCANRMNERFENYEDAGKHCDDIECTLRDDCDTFCDYFSNEEEWIKQVEQRERIKKLNEWLGLIREEYPDLGLRFDSDAEFASYYWEVGMEHGLEGMRRATDLENSSDDMNQFLNHMTEDIDPNGYYRGNDILEIFNYHPNTIFNISEEYSIYEPHSLHAFINFMFCDHGIDTVYNTLLEALDYRDMYLEAEAKIIPEDSVVTDNNIQEEMLNWAAAHIF